MTSLLWLRRDLRLHDHAALSQAAAGGTPVQPVFVFDTEILSRFTRKDDRRISFILQTLRAMHRELAAAGSGILLLHGNAREVIPKLSHALQSPAVYYAEDFEPATRARDNHVAQTCHGASVPVLDHLIRAPKAIVKADGSPYRVYTPYYKAWHASLTPADRASSCHDGIQFADLTQSARAAVNAGLHVLSLDDAPERILAAMGYQLFAETEWLPHKAASQLAAFIANTVQDYPKTRDYPAISGTSALSPYLRFGLVSIRQCLAAAMARGNSDTWIKELCWREFYAQILYHFPETAGLEFEPKYRGTIPWNRDPAWHEAFVHGRTGYPMVDAGIRELLTRGWMHNRVRMIVASFASKDLLMDWRVGEEFFAQHLMDYELASNVGGWQWSSSTGTDAAPYFRVFNPVLQSKKFDPDGAYIRRYIPEIAHLANEDIHAPWESENPPASYPAPMVDHFKARDRALAAFKVTS